MTRTTIRHSVRRGVSRLMVLLWVWTAAVAVVVHNHYAPVYSGSGAPASVHHAGTPPPRVVSDTCGACALLQGLHAAALATFDIPLAAGLPQPEAALPVIACFVRTPLNVYLRAPPVS